MGHFEAVLSRTGVLNVPEGYAQRMCEPNNCLGLLLATLSAAALIADVGWLARITSWLSSLTIIWATVIAAPGYRLDIHWRSLALYAFTITLSIVSAVELAKGDYNLSSFAFPFAFGVVYLLICLITAALYYYCPVTANPEITGKYKRVGTTTFTIPCCPPDATPATSALAVQCWFPIDHTPSRFEQYALLWTSGHPDYQLQESANLSTALTKTKGMPSFVTKHLALGRTKSFWQSAFDKLICKEELPKLPIAVYSHGMYGWRQIHHTACEKLASEGFVVFACDYVPDCLLTRPLGEDPTYFDFATPTGLKHMQERAFYQTGLERRVVQLSTLISHIISDDFITTFPELRNRLDHEHINCWGHSFGGLTISAMCCRGEDYPFKINSAVVLDGWMFPLPVSDREKGLHHTSLLNISSDKWNFGNFQVPFRNDLVQNTLKRSSRSDDLQFVLDLVLQGAAHQNFVDMYFLGHRSLLGMVKMVGTVDLFEAIDTINHILPVYFRGVTNLKKSRVASGSAEAVSLKLEVNNLVSAHPFVTSQHEEITRLGEICHAGRTPQCTTSISTSTAVKQQVNTNEPPVLPERVVRFVNKHFAPAKCMPEDYTSFATWDLVREHERANSGPGAKQVQRQPK